MITDGVTPEPARRLQAHPDQAVPQGRQGVTHRDHHQRHHRLRDRQTAAPICPRCGRSAFTANRRLLRVQSISHDPITGADALHTDHRTGHAPHPGPASPACAWVTQRSHALLAALPLFRLQPDGFTNKTCARWSPSCAALARADDHRRTDHLRSAPAAGAVGHAVFDIPHFVVMEQKMMRGIRDRAQKTHRDETEDLLATPVRRRPDETRPTGPSTNPKMMVSWLSVRACTGPELPDARIGGVQAAGVRVTL